ncbi:dephospho-CoA kinase [Phaeobacter gallaeciensis]|uniref:Dephospho-CoA kinase n=1 Tax=Phaeobacter gallaeciensis TaxID=60890 RepID=A0AAC9ZCI8_9RHOB|nr:dephospho-CoA kinase [Phaeobacter gallaeciensis]AHD11298.1 dephospho-CoA kinase [Phaeobacter gallaeciensis DSM 26640]ATE94561.1 dephospho-CoA kinase CoaE [Phaeobacter gallaeciensis]ATE98834.1 dephospho-CoA kinase CoaE [Phaeobacter gallaeciensis]ATF03225.1 dephospho-CoA kinase CoaE [Phaeobacter gallaeciensis]ATF07605.1 dephospho-CoA kinase CoaE [Phaeobacter gallaeciensis]
MSYALGLTGSIGMGKSATAQIFADEGCAVWDADAAVHRLYDVGGAAVAPIGDVWPAAVIEGRVDRGRLRDIIAGDGSALPRIETIVHPLVAADREAFKTSSSHDVLVFDIPLLFETGGDAGMDAVACVWIDAETQRQRVLARQTMTVEQFEQILQKQMPIEDKKARADYLIETDTPDHAQAQVRSILAQIRRQIADA